MGNSYKKKKPTKNQFFNEILPKEISEKMKEFHIKGIIEGYEICNKMLLGYAKNHTKEEIIDFCQKNIKNKQVIKDIVNK